MRREVAQHEWTPCAERHDTLENGSLFLVLAVLRPG